CRRRRSERHHRRLRHHSERCRRRLGLRHPNHQRGRHHARPDRHRALMLLADAITSDSSISIGLVVTLMLAAVAALTSAVTTRNKAAELEKDLEGAGARIWELEKWQLSV